MRFQRLAKAAATLGVPTVATALPFLHHGRRRRLADVLTAIRLRTTIDAIGFAAEPNAEACLKPPAEMLRLFQGHEEAVTNAQRVIDAAVQLHGGDGVRHGFAVERLYREIRALRIYEGASDVQRVVIARSVLG